MGTLRQGETLQFVLFVDIMEVVDLGKIAVVDFQPEYRDEVVLRIAPLQRGGQLEHCHRLIKGIKRSSQHPGLLTGHHRQGVGIAQFSDVRQRLCAGSPGPALSLQRLLNRLAGQGKFTACRQHFPPVVAEIRREKRAYIGRIGKVIAE